MPQSNSIDPGSIGSSTRNPTGNLRWVYENLAALCVLRVFADPLCLQGLQIESESKPEHESSDAMLHQRDIPIQQIPKLGSTELEIGQQLCSMNRQQALDNLVFDDN